MEEEDDDELFQVTFSCSDSCDAAPSAEATLNGVPVTNGQLVELEAGDGRDPELSDGRLSLEAPVFTLDVSCVDASGNWGHGMTELVIEDTP